LEIKIDFNREPLAPLELKEKINYLIKKRNAILKSLEKENKKLQCRLSLSSGLLFLALLNYILTKSEIIVSNYALSGLCLILSLVFFLTLFNSRKSQKEFNIFIQSYRTTGSFDLRNVKLMTASYLETPAEPHQLLALRELPSNEYLKDLKNYVNKVLTTRELSSFEYGQILAEYKKLMKKEAQDAQNQAVLNFKESLKAEP